MLKKCLLPLVLFVPFSCHAAFVDHGTYITDTDTGYDWLKLTETVGLSFNEVAGDLGAGGQFAGWHYENTDPNTNLYNIVSGMDVYELNSFLDLYGDLGAPGDPTSSLDYVITGEYSAEPGFLDSWYIKADTDPSNPDISINFNQLYGADTVFPLTGHALVRVSAVPIPGVSWLFFTALMGLLNFRKKLDC